MDGHTCHSMCVEVGGPLCGDGSLSSPAGSHGKYHPPPRISPAPMCRLTQKCTFSMSSVKRLSQRESPYPSPLSLALSGFSSAILGCLSERRLLSLLLNNEGWPPSKLNLIFQVFSRLLFILSQDDQNFMTNKCSSVTKTP